MRLLQEVGKKRHFYKGDGQEIENLTSILGQAETISLVGGGGKTSTMYQLGMEYAAKGQKVIMTTSTKIRAFANEFPDNLSCFGTEQDDGKLAGLEDPDSLRNQCDILLIEADGSKGLPVKMPADHEPVITEGTELVIAVLGLKAIGKPIHLVCHRWEMVAHFLGKKGEDLLNVEDVCQIILSPQGLSKNVAERSFAVILNQVDQEEDLENGKKIAALLPDFIPCIMTSYEESIIISEIS